MTRRPQSIKVGDEVFAYYADSFVGTEFIIGGTVLPSTIRTSNKSLVTVRIDRIYSASFGMGMPAYLWGSDKLPAWTGIPREQIRHINDVRFLK